MKKVVFPLVGAVMCLAGSVAYADPAPAGDGGVITFTGLATGQTCTLNNKNFIVALPTISVSALKSAGSTAGATGFAVSLSDCPASGKAHVYWVNGSTTLADGNLQNAGTATNVELQLQDYNGGSPATIDLSKADGAQNSQSVQFENGTANLQYAVQYISPNGGLTAGSITSNVSYQIVYQ
jgi:major type 1 subunit fimbrin (pilin)